MPFSFASLPRFPSLCFEDPGSTRSLLVLPPGEMGHPEGLGPSCSKGQGSSAAWIKRRSSTGREREPTGAVQMPRQLVYPPNHSLPLLFRLKVLERESNSGICLGVSRRLSKLLQEAFLH